MFLDVLFGLGGGTLLRRKHLRLAQEDAAAPGAAWLVAETAAWMAAERMSGLSPNVGGSSCGACKRRFCACCSSLHSIT